MSNTKVYRLSFTGGAAIITETCAVAEVLIEYEGEFLIM